MCLVANKINPKEGLNPEEFDENGYITCWKAYDILYGKLRSPCYPKGATFVNPGWIVSDRRSKKISRANGDITYAHCESNGVEHGIHVFLDEVEAKRTFGCDSCVIVPVRCHRSQLVAVGKYGIEAVFMKVFLKKADYKKATKNE